jgi:hypothetical protein
MAQVPAPPGPLTPPRTEEEMRRFIAEYDALTDFDMQVNLFVNL